MTDEAVLDDELSLMVSDENLNKNNFPSDLWVGDTGATCHMGPSLAGCTDIKYVTEKVTVGDNRTANIKARATFHSTIIGKEGEERDGGVRGCLAQLVDGDALAVVLVHHLEEVPVPTGA